MLSLQDILINYIIKYELFYYQLPKSLQARILEKKYEESLKLIRAHDKQASIEFYFPHSLCTSYKYDDMRVKYSSTYTDLRQHEKYLKKAAVEFGYGSYCESVPWNEIGRVRLMTSSKLETEDFIQYFPKPRSKYIYNDRIKMTRLSVEEMAFGKEFVKIKKLKKFYNKY